MVIGRDSFGRWCTSGTGLNDYGGLQNGYLDKMNNDWLNLRL